MYNSNMVLYYLNNLITTGKAPKEMADPSCRTDYAKLKNLVRLDRLDGDRKGVLMKIAEKLGITMSELMEGVEDTSL